MDIEEVLREIKLVSDILCNKHLEPFCDTIDELVSTPVQHHEGNESIVYGHLGILAEDVKPLLQTKIDQGHEVLKKQLARTTQKQTDVRHLMEVRENLKRKNENQEIRVQKMRKQCHDYQEKLNNLQNLSDCILICKILTGTNFAFKKGNTTGYMKNQNTRCFEVFDFNNSQVNQQDITKKLWALLKDVSKKENENQMVQINNNKKIIFS